MDLKDIELPLPSKLSFSEVVNQIKQAPKYFEINTKDISEYIIEDLTQNGLKVQALARSSQIYIKVCFSVSKKYTLARFIQLFTHELNTIGIPFSEYNNLLEGSTHIADSLKEKLTKSYPTYDALKDCQLNIELSLQAPLMEPKIIDDNTIAILGYEVSDHIDSHSISAYYACKTNQLKKADKDSQICFTTPSVKLNHLYVYREDFENFLKQHNNGKSKIDDEAKIPGERSEKAYLKTIGLFAKALASKTQPGKNKITISQLTNTLELHLPENSHGLSSKSLEKRISQGLKLLEE